MERMRYTCYKRSGSCHFSCQRGVSPQTNSLKPLVALLEFWWVSNEIFGMPKGGLGENIYIAMFQLALYLDLRVP